jgi:Kdo2-lipid IVA lauroyltransferase/acyltransferase
MYYLLYGLFYLLSLVPMRALYWLSDGIYGLVYYLVGYRKAVVMGNLLRAFPEKTEIERTKIAKEFYHNFIDSYLETVKLLTASKRFIMHHFKVDNPHLYEQVLASGHKCQVLLGHTLNWEYANLAMPFYTDYSFIVAFMPLTNQAFNRLLLTLRGRTGTIMLPANQLRRSIIPYRKSVYMLSLVADQAPANPGASFWLNFFGYPTPFLRGPERGARIADVPVLFCHFYKTTRGSYRAKLDLISDHPAELAEGELTVKYVNHLEQAIRRHPGLYLWSHRRWKYAWIPEYEKLWIDRSDPIPLV